MLLKRLILLLNVLALRGGGAGLSVLFTLAVSRYLPAEPAADFLFLFNLSVICAVCFRWGMDEVIIRRVASSNGGAPLIAASLVALSHRRVIFLFLISLPLFFLYFHFFSSMDSARIVQLFSALCIAVFLALTACMARVAQGRGHVNRAAFLLNIVTPGLLLLGLFYFVYAEGFLDADTLVYLYFGIALSVYMISFYRLYGCHLELLKLCKSIPWKNEDSYSANKLGVVVLAQQLLTWVALLLTPYFYGAADYREFVVTHKVATLVSLTMLVVNFTFSRQFAFKYANSEWKSLRQMIFYSLVLIFASALFFSLFVLVLRHEIYSYANINDGAVGLLFILLSSQLFFSVAALFSTVLSMAHEDNYLLTLQLTINGIGALLFTVACSTASLEVASITLVFSYMSLSIFLGWRVHEITKFEKVKK